jgi:pfkB family carbohydrate kinase
LVYASRVKRTHRPVPARQRLTARKSVSHPAIGGVRGAQDGPRFQYTTVGHVTADVLPDGTRRPGGTAFYGALQAARLGLRARVITKGVAAEIETLLAPYRGELELEVVPAAQTTTLATSTRDGRRIQQLRGWAGPMPADLAVETAILHLAPIARETPSRWRGRTDFVGLTPQGLIRAWRDDEGEDGGEIGQVALAPGQLPDRCDAAVVSESEREACASMLPGGGAASRALAAVIAVTAEAQPTTLYLPGGEIARVEVPRIERIVDDLGAGDVFAAAFFVALREGQTPRGAAAFANAAAAVRLAGEGAGAVGGRAAVETRLRATA